MPINTYQHTSMVCLSSNLSATFTAIDDDGGCEDADDDDDGGGGGLHTYAGVLCLC